MAVKRKETEGIGHSATSKSKKHLLQFVDYAQEFGHSCSSKRGRKKKRTLAHTRKAEVEYNPFAEMKVSPQSTPIPQIVPGPAIPMPPFSQYPSYTMPSAPVAQAIVPREQFPVQIFPNPIQLAPNSSGLFYGKLNQMAQIQQDIFHLMQSQNYQYPMMNPRGITQVIPVQRLPMNGYMNFPYPYKPLRGDPL